jgi:hypothetical protein
MQEQIDLLVSGGTVVAQNPARNIIAGGAIAIRGSRSEVCHLSNVCI